MFSLQQHCTVTVVLNLPLPLAEYKTSKVDQSLLLADSHMLGIFQSIHNVEAVQGKNLTKESWCLKAP